MENFLQRHAGSVTGMLSGFDRVRLRGTIRLLANSNGLAAVLSYLGILLKDFKTYAMDLSEQLKSASLEVAMSAQRPVVYLSSSRLSKEDLARQIAHRDKIESGLICVLTAVEPCWSFHVRRDPAQKKLVLESSWRKCLHLYHYFMHPTLGFMHARVQSWLPFNVHVCINGREWLARQMEQAGMSYRRSDNCFTWIDDPARAQALFDDQLKVDWASMLDGVLQQAHPANTRMFPRRPMNYYWSADESEWASDVMFKDARALSAVYPMLVRHGIQNLSGRDIMRFLGRRDPFGGGWGAFKGEVVSDLKQRKEGMRLKHRVNANSIKMYDKQGSVLRVETTINNTRDFKVYRAADGQETPVQETPVQEAPAAGISSVQPPVVQSPVVQSPVVQSPVAKAKWRPMRKGVSDMHRRSQVCQAANERYLQAMASVQDKTSLKELAEPLCRAVKWNDRSVRGLNPLSEKDATLLEHAGRGEFTLNGFRNRDLRRLLFDTPPADEKQARRQSAAVTRMIRMLRAHGLVHKVPKTHRYVVSGHGRTTITALLCARHADAATLAA